MNKILTAEEVMEHIAELEKELAEEARLNGMGAEREAKLLARVAELEKRIASLENTLENYKSRLRALNTRFIELLKENEALKQSCDFWQGLAKTMEEK